MSLRCSEASRARCEATLGTASRARRWILLEQPGAWGADALHSSALPPAVADQLTTWAREVPARVLLLRRPGGGPAGPGRALYLGVSGPDGSWLERFDLDRVEDVHDVDPSGLPDATTKGGTPVERPLYLVCTNGAHDACCALYGLPVAAALAAVHGDQVWECSHVGGDRFAGNLVCLPEGRFYGHLDPETAQLAAAEHAAGRIDLEHFRGHSHLPFDLQAAEALVRRELALVDADAVRVLDSVRTDEGRRVRLTLTDGTQVQAEVTVHRDGSPAPLTCGSAPGVPPRYELRSLRTTGDGRPPARPGAT